jgi:Carboxyl transferase domain
MGERVAESRRRHAEALQMGGEQAVDRHRASGRLPVRERIALLLDEGSWFETGVLAQPERRTGKKVPGDGVVTGFGRLDGRTAGLIGIDATVLAGTTAPVSMRGGRAGPGRAGQGDHVRRPVRHVQPAAGIPARRARPDDRRAGRAGRHPARL